MQWVFSLQTEISRSASATGLMIGKEGLAAGSGQRISTVPKSKLSFAPAVLAASSIPEAL